MKYGATQTGRQADTLLYCTPLREVPFSEKSSRSFLHIFFNRLQFQGLEHVVSRNQRT